MTVLVGAGDIAPENIWLLYFFTDHNNMDTVGPSSVNGESCDII